MNYELLRIAIALAGTAYLAWQDARTSFMDERILYVMAVGGLALDLLWGGGNVPLLLSTVGVAAAIFAVGYVFYRLGQLGGGDVWLFTALQLLLPFNPMVGDALMPSISAVAPNFAAASALAGSLSGRVYPFILSVAAASALFALWGSALMYGWKLRGKRLQPDQRLLVAMLIVMAGGLLYLNSVVRLSNGVNLLLALLFIPSIFLTTFKRQLLQEVVVKRITIPQIEDEDILAIEFMPQRIVSKYRLDRVLTKAEVAKLRRVSRAEGISRFPVCKVLPRFGPYILLGLIASLLVGDIFAFALLL